MLKNERIQMAQFVRKMRKISGLTQIQLSELMGLSQGKISQLECNKEVSLLDYLNAIEALIKNSNSENHFTRPYRVV